MFKKITRLLSHARHRHQKLMLRSYALLQEAVSLHTDSTREAAHAT